MNNGISRHALKSTIDLPKRDRGEMSELAEGARLEIACTTTSGTEGSNPSLSAIPFFIPDILDVIIDQAGISNKVCYVL